MSGVWHVGATWRKWINTSWERATAFESVKLSSLYFEFVLTTVSLYCIQYTTVSMWTPRWYPALNYLSVYNSILGTPCIQDYIEYDGKQMYPWDPLSLKLKTVYRYKNQFCNPGFTNGVRQFRGFQYFCNEIWIYLVSSCSQSLLFLNRLNQNLHKC